MKKHAIFSLSNFVILILFSVIIIACNNKETETKISKETDVVIIKKCLSKLYQSGSKESYLVSPKYDKFELNTFFRYNKVLEKYQKYYDYNQNSKKVLHSLTWTQKQFDEIKLMIDKKYLNKTNPLLPKLSEYKESHTVYFFSGIHENLVFATVIDYCGSIKESDLNSSSFNKNQKFVSAGSIIFILKDGEVAEIIFDSDIVLEYQCSD